MPICCVTLILRHCDVLMCTPHLSGFDSGRPWPSPCGRVIPSGDASNSAVLRNCRKPCIWTFLTRFFVGSIVRRKDRYTVSILQSP